MRPDHPRGPIAPIFGSSGEVADVVTHSKFHVDRFRGFAPRGGRNSPFPILRPLAYTTGLGYRPTCDNIVSIQYHKAAISRPIVSVNCKQQRRQNGTLSDTQTIIRPNIIKCFQRLFYCFGRSAVFGVLISGLGTMPPSSLCTCLWVPLGEFRIYQQMKSSTQSMHAQKSS